MSEPVKIMLDGMTEKPIAIPFPFSIGGWIISDPDDWHSFKRINAEFQALADKRLLSLNAWKRSAKAHRAWGMVLANTLKLSTITSKLALERAELAETMLKFERQEGITDNKLRIRVEALADKRLVLLKEINEHHLTFGECLFCTMLELEEGYEHDPDCELAEAIDAA